MAIEILKAASVILAAGLLFGLFVIAFRAKSVSHDFSRSDVRKALKQGEFFVQFNPGCSDSVEYVLRRLISMTLCREFSRWYITVSAEGLDDESLQICRIFALNHKCVRIAGEQPFEASVQEDSV